MELFVARQPILDRKSQVVAYELLARSGPENFFHERDADAASARVIAASGNDFGLDQLAQGKRLFVNVTRKVLLDELVCTLPAAQTVVEILETIEPDAQIARACRRLKERGYALALDDYTERLAPLVELADVVKVDFRTLDRAGRSQLAARLARPGITLLAEKVETRDDYEQGVADGYQLFQGYWFHRPQMLAARDIPASRLSRLQLLETLGRPELDFDRLERVLKNDVSLSVKLLRYLNSAAFGFSGSIRSIRHALVLLGQGPCRRWASLLALADLSSSHPPALLASCLTRAHFCETLAPRVAPRSSALDFFLGGLLSAVDVLVGRPMEELTAQLRLPAPVRDTLLGRRDSAPGRALDLALACERGDWETARGLERRLDLEEPVTHQAFEAAVAWADQTTGHLYR